MLPPYEHSGPSLNCATLGIATLNHWTVKKCPLKENRSPGARLKLMPLLALIVLPGNHPAEGKNTVGIKLLLKEMEYWEISSSGGTLTPA
jgi:hypothetical protein